MPISVLQSTTNCAWWGGTRSKPAKQKQKESLFCKRNTVESNETRRMTGTKLAPGQGKRRIHPQSKTSGLCTTRIFKINAFLNIQRNVLGDLLPFTGTLSGFVGHTPISNSGNRITGVWFLMGPADRFLQTCQLITCAHKAL